MYVKKIANISNYTVDETYREALTYDKNGNIRTLNRTGGNLPNGSVLDLDDLEYTYLGNQLLKVTDATNNPDGFKEIPTSGNAYSYDGSGNLKTDVNKGVIDIAYNHLHLPTLVRFNDSQGSTIEYTYSADGVKQSKRIQPGNIVTEYIDGFQYLNGTLELFHTA